MDNETLLKTIEELNGRVKALELKVQENSNRIVSDLGGGTSRTEGNIVRNINGISEKIAETRSKMAELVREVKEAAQKADGTIKREIDSELDKLRKASDAHEVSLSAIDIDLRGDKTDVNPGLLYTVKQLNDWYRSQSAQVRLVIGSASVILAVAGYIFSNNIEGRISTNAVNIGKNSESVSKQDTAIAEIKRDIDWIREQLSKK